MRRIIRIALKNLFLIPYVHHKAGSVAKKRNFTPEQLDTFGKKYLDKMHRAGGIRIHAFGVENVPKDLRGAMLVSNHQGTEDAFAILATTPIPTSYIKDTKWKGAYLYDNVNRAFEAVVIDKNDLKGQVVAYNEVAKQLKNGRNYILFPEAEYTDNKNTLMEFHGACMYPILKTNCPVIPVCVYDTYKPFTEDTKNVDCEVHYLAPIYPEEYAGMNRKQLAEYIKARIQAKMDELIASHETQK